MILQEAYMEKPLQLSADWLQRVHSPSTLVHGRSRKECHYQAQLTEAGRFLINHQAKQASFLINHQAKQAETV